MFEYHLNVLGGDGNKQKLYVIQSGHELKHDTLQTIGLILDEGTNPNELDHIWETASMYVEVKQR